MTLDGTTLIALLALLVSGPIGWAIRALWEKVQKVSDDLGQHKVHVAEAYVEKDDMHRHLVEIKSMIKRIFDKMDKKP